MTRTSVFLAFFFLAGACGGSSDTDPKSPSTTEVKAPDEKSENNIKMSPGAPATGKPKQSKPADDKPAPAPPAPAPK